MNFIELALSDALLLKVLVFLFFAKQFNLALLSPLQILIERFYVFILLIELLFKNFLPDGTEQVDINQFVVALNGLLLALGNLLQNYSLLEILQKIPLLFLPLLRILRVLLLGVLVYLLFGENEIESSFLGRILFISVPGSTPKVVVLLRLD